ncbi:class I SAM-dependent methyltransferase [Streptomyces sp. 769]|uniref:SAM-dependent methyltransferase n=1 Tax=Streptomyces sp. 769 TaxID=1262452 RepID=UPI00057C69DA|nr:class I SAM-dependent methyltransferase [Streptomyces sp. 769]
MTSSFAADPRFMVIRGPHVDSYEEKVVATYEGDPKAWRRVLGDHLLFEWGIYNHPDSPRPVSLDEAGVRFFEEQLELAGFANPAQSSPRRILDLGCGWGYILGHLATRFPDCPRLDGVNISRRQLEYCADYLHAHQLTGRARLYLCNALDVGLLPDPATLYDLVVIRGVITHFPHALYEQSMAALADRVRPGGLLIISDTLYNTAPATYRSAIPDEVDRLAVGHRKTPDYFAKVLADSGFAIQDMRVLPSNTDVAHWLLEVRSNLETHFPNGVTSAFEELRVLATNLSIALLTDQVSAYSVIARRMS